MLNTDGIQAGIFFKFLTLFLSLFSFILIGINDTNYLGEYYTILSITLIAGFFDFGSSVMFKAKISESFIKNKIHFQSQYIYFALIFYFIVSIIFFLAFISFCIAILGNSISYNLILMIAITYAVNFFFLSLEIIAESLNLTKKYYMYKTYFYLLAPIFIFFIINSNNILFLLFIFPILNIFSGIFFLTRHPIYSSLKNFSPKKCTVLFKRNINFQVKLITVWLMGYLSYQLILPLSYNFYGPETTGKIGYTLNLINSILTIGITVNNLFFPKLVYFFNEHGRKNLALLIFKQNLIVLIASLAFLSFFYSIWHQSFFNEIKLKMLDLNLVFILIFIAGIRVALQINSNYFRVQGIEKHLLLTIIMALCMGGIFLFLNDNIYILFLSQLISLIAIILISLIMINIDYKNNLIKE